MSKVTEFLGRFRRSQGVWVFTAILVGVTSIASCANLLFPEDSIFHVSTYTITLLGKYLCYAMLALAVDLIWGYCGILSLGHGAFFALGGYAMGMYLVRQVGERGQYGNPDIPDAMVSSGWETLPWYWTGMDEFWFASLMVFFIPGLLAFMFGWLAFRSKVTGVYFSIITQAMTYVFQESFYRDSMGFGGQTGLNGFIDIIGFDLRSDNTRVALFALTGFLLLVVFLTSQKIMKSKLGRVYVAIRDGEPRTRFLGYRTETYKVWLFVYSALVAGLAGALFVPQVGIINPDEFSPVNSIEVVVWVAIGGRGTLYGAVLGAVLVNYAKTKFTVWIADSWLFLLGGLFVLVTLFLPKGIMGLFVKDDEASAVGERTS